MIYLPISFGVDSLTLEQIQLNSVRKSPIDKDHYKWLKKWRGTEQVMLRHSLI